MTGADIIDARRRHQRLTGAGATTAAGIVSWLGAVQSQDYTGAKWGVGLRGPGLTDAAVEAAFDRGEILRTHVLRPTWHFVAAADLRWLLPLSAPRVHRMNAPYYRANGIDSALMVKVRRVFERTLASGFATRGDLAAALAGAKIEAAGQRLAYMVMHAELDGVICSGPRRGKQFTYALVDQRAPAVAGRAAGEALAELALRYFQSHGPATIRDFSWWSGMTQGEIKTAVATLGRQLDVHTLDGRSYLTAAGSLDEARTGRHRRAARAGAFLLPNYDESLIAYRDRQALGGPPPPGARRFAALPHHLVVQGRVAGAWRRTERGTGVEVTVEHDGVSCRPAMLRDAGALLEAFLERPVALHDASSQRKRGSSADGP